MRAVVLLAVGLLSACAPRPPLDSHVPPFARIPYEPFSRDAVVAIALREWRLFGSPVDDNPPGSYRPAAPDDKPERQQGLWQRVGEYWWLAMNAGDPESAWTGKHDATWRRVSGQRGWRPMPGRPRLSPTSCALPAPVRDFPYSASHSDYIDIAKQTWRRAGRRAG